MTELYKITLIDVFFTYIQILSLIILTALVQNEKNILKKWRGLMILLLPAVVGLILSTNPIVSDPNIKLLSRLIYYLSFYGAMYIYTGNFKKSITVLVFFSMITLPMVLVFYNMTSSDDAINLAYTQLYAGIIITLHYIVLIYFFSRKKYISYKERILKITNKIRFFLYFLFSFDILSTIYLSSIKLDIKGINKILTSFYSPIWIIFFLLIVIVVITIQNINSTRLEKEVLDLRCYTNTVEELYKDMRYYKHDINNILLSMKHYISIRDIDSIEKFYEKRIEGFKSINLELYYLIAKLEQLKIYELKGLILSKYQLAKNKGICFEVLILDEIRKINMDTIDLCRVIGIVLDNAIEASNEVEKPSVVVEMSKDKYITINVSNIYSVESHKRLFLSKQLSTKGLNRGNGLKSLNRIVRKYENVSLKTKIKQNLYTQEIIIE